MSDTSEFFMTLNDRNFSATSAYDKARTKRYRLRKGNDADELSISMNTETETDTERKLGRKPREQRLRNGAVGGENGDDNPANEEPVSDIDANANANADTDVLGQDALIPFQSDIDTDTDALPEPASLDPFGQSDTDALPTSSQTDIKSISDHLRRLKTIDAMKIPAGGIDNKDRLLRLSRDVELNTAFLLNTWADNNKFRNSPKSKGIIATANLLQMGGVDLDLNSLLSQAKIVPAGMTTEQFADLYPNLYRFNLALVDDLVKSKQKPSDVMNNLRSFLRDTLNLSGSFMNDKQVISDDLVKSNYDLLLLLNNLSIHQAAATEANLSQLNNTYDELTKLVSDNIGLYNQVKDAKESKPSEGAATTEFETKAYVEQLIKDLGTKIKALKEQNEILTANSKEMTKANTSIKDLVKNRTVENLADNVLKLENK